MSEKRRDNKGRILRIGESQRKDGRYAYKYNDANGKTRFLYAWKLVSTDKTPDGKRESMSLREKEKAVSRDIEDGINTAGGKITVTQLYENHIAVKRNLKLRTRRVHEYTLSILRDDPLGAASIDRVKQSDAKQFAVRMSERGLAYSSIKLLKRNLSSAFAAAVEDDRIRKNPFNFDLSTVMTDTGTSKSALTCEQEKALLSFAKNDVTYKKYYDDLVILLGTGLLISELCGLTSADVDFDKGVINVDHQLIADNKVGYYIETPKTKHGVRQVPMSGGVYESFLRVLERTRDTDTRVGEYTHFLFLTDKGKPRVGKNYDSMLDKLTSKYNKLHVEKLPHITPHILRHTFCTRMAESGMNPKALQYIMGHSSITMTMNYYTHITYDSAKAEMERINA